MAWCDRLDYIYLACPVENLFHKRIWMIEMPWVANLIVEIPHHHARVLSEGGQHILHIALILGVSVADVTWALQPLAIVNPWDGLGLFPWLISCSPTVVEQHKQGLVAMVWGNIQESIDTVQETRLVIEVGSYVEEYSQ